MTIRSHFETHHRRFLAEAVTLPASDGLCFRFCAVEGVAVVVPVLRVAGVLGLFFSCWAFRAISRAL